jgi:oligoribonuclease NrnB/cAMP/cGMP phosphodiesterase (DHH superfamily)
VLYHDNCPDGWTAAWVAHHSIAAMGERRPDLIPVTHGQPPPDLTGVDQVIIADFAYSHEIMTEMAQGRQVVVLDHHRSAIDDIRAAHGMGDSDGPLIIQGQDGYSGVFDENRSGAGIVFDYFHQGADRPPLVDYVEDRDLWRFALPGSDLVNAYIRTQPYDLASWDNLASQLEEQPERIWAMGGGALAHIQAYCRAAANHAYMCRMGDREFPIVNVTYESCSEVADHLLDVFEVDMAGYYFERLDGMWQYGFRSRNGTTVHDHAIAFGGGGHPQASGCSVPEPVHERI